MATRPQRRSTFYITYKFSSYLTGSTIHHGSAARNSTPPLHHRGGLTEHKNIIHFIKVQLLRWLGHVERIPEERHVKKIYKWKLIAS
jgi:hypothetical protein